MKKYKNIIYETSQEPLSINKIIYDVFLKEESPGDLIALYNFYYYTSKWQNTSQIKATTKYVAQGLQWSEKKVRLIKQKLKDLGVIESIIRYDSNHQKIIGHYIKVNLFLSKELLENNFHRRTNSHRVRNCPSNAFKNKYINASAFQRKAVEEEDKKTKINLSKFFDKFWKIYPKHAGKGSALTSWNKLCRKPKHPTWEEIKYAILKQKKTKQWSNPTYVPHASTWLNQSRWLDDPSEMNGWENNASNSSKDLPSATSILELHFGEEAGRDSCGSPQQWMDNCIEPLCAHFDCSDSLVAKGCTILFDWYDQKSRYENSPSPLQLVINYIKWLMNDEQSWIKEINNNVFDPEKTIFKKFFKYYEREILGRQIYSRASI